MSYCVNCGVELAETEQSCPLCFVEVKNPLKPFDPEIPPLYPDVPLRGVFTDRRDLILPFTLLLLLPVLMCLAADFLTSGSLDWSLYVIPVFLLLCVSLLPPLAMRRKRTFLCLCLDWIAVGIFLYTLDLMTPGTWFMAVAVPFLLGGGVIVLGIAAIFVYRLILRLVKTAIAMFAMGTLALFGDFLIKRYQQAQRPVGWSLLVFAPCLILGLVLLVANHNQRLKDQMKQRFFV